MLRVVASELGEEVTGLDLPSARQAGRGRESFLELEAGVTVLGIDRVDDVRLGLEPRVDRCGARELELLDRKSVV